jgi:transposase
MPRPGTAPSYCPGCLDKQRQINDLQEEVRGLRAKLRYQERTAKEGPFGSSTPSSKLPVKPSALPERQARKGGGQPGHAGNGRKAVPAGAADKVVDVPAPERCPHCGGRVIDKGTRDRHVQDAQPVKVVRIVYRLGRARCAQCGRSVQAQPPGVLPKCQYSTGLLAHVAVQHYVYGVTLGQLEKQMGIGYGSLMDAMHQLAKRLAGVPEQLIREYRQAPVKHADETGWRNDGGNGYAWLFCTPELSIFVFRPSRAGTVAREILGSKPLPGVLVVDRYAGYNQAPCQIQYCYAHLLRDLQDLEKNFPDQPEVPAFVGTLAPWLASAMALRGLKLSAGQFKKRAADLRRSIHRVVNQPARHPAVQSYQDIFRQKAKRLYHWADDPAVPAENNRAERELRPLVVARKVSFGSQSQRGAATRGILMTALHTLRKRTGDVAAAFKDFLDHLARNPKADTYSLLFPRHAHTPP